ncbi:MAG: alpha/beta fold hydrolase [Rhodospirillales bacterium]|nr:alpha/beta fold hydrolase [Rhodospirillales bacterium]
MRFVEGVNLVNYPPDADPAAGAAAGAIRRAPAILFLHGMGERGDRPDALPAVSRWGLAKFRDERRRLLDRPFPFRVVAPQCPTTSTWCDADVQVGLDRLIEDMSARDADPTRLYLTGFSMGGIGAFCLALRQPRRFAALATVCGSCRTPEALAELAHLPAWVAYGEDDEIAELTAGSRDIVARLGAHGRLVERAYRLGHRGGQGPHVRTCDAAYEEPELYDWLLSHRLEG